MRKLKYVKLFENFDDFSNWIVRIEEISKELGYMISSSSEFPIPHFPGVNPNYIKIRNEANEDAKNGRKTAYIGMSEEQDEIYAFFALPGVDKDKSLEELQSKIVDTFKMDAKVDFLRDSTAKGSRSSSLPMVSIITIRKK